MSSKKPRAAVVAVDAGRILVMLRHKNGRDYAVLPGGGVEPGESPGAAALRELEEETGLTATLERHLWSLAHADRTAHYFAVRLARRGPLVLGGPEVAKQSPENSYEPAWVDLAALDEINLIPAELRPRLLRLQI